MQRNAAVPTPTRRARPDGSRLEPARSLLLLHPDASVARRIHDAARERFDVRAVAGWPELEDAVRLAGPSAVVAVDPYHGDAEIDGDNRAQGLRRLLNQFPSANVVGLVSAGPRFADDLRALGTWGVHEVIDLDEDRSDAALLQRLLRARGRPLASLVDRGLPVSLPPTGRAILDAAVEIVGAGGQPSDLADALEVSHDTLLRLCIKSGLPVPRRLLAWLRLLLAADLLDDPGQSVQQVALASGYGSADALRRRLRDYVGLAPGRLREGGAHNRVVRAFAKELRQAVATRRRKASPTT